MARTQQRDDRDDARLLVEAAAAALEALVAIRSRIAGGRDATSATGQLLLALVDKGGALAEYDRPKIWGLRHALGGEGFHNASEHAATATILATLVAALEEPKSHDQATRRETSRREMIEIAKLLVRCETTVEATRALEAWDKGNAQSLAAAHKLAHEQRLSQSGARGASLTQPAAPPPAPKIERLGEGDFPLPGSADDLTVG